MNTFDAVRVRIARYRRRLGTWLSVASARSLWVWLALGLLSDNETTLAPGVGLTTFDQVWNQVREAHYDYPSVRETWETAGSSMRVRAEAAATSADLHAVIAELLGRLQDSHYALLPADVMSDGIEFGESARTPGQTGLTVALAEGRILVTGVRKGSAADTVGIRRGMSLLEIDGNRLESRLAPLAELAPGRLRRWTETFTELAVQNRIGWPNAGAPLEIVMESPEAVVHRYQVLPSPSSMTPFSFGNLPPMHFEFSARPLERPGNTCVGLVQFSAWVPALGSALEQAMPELRECRGLVIDLRGNPGGVMAMMMPVAGWLFDEVTTLGTMRNQAGEIHFRASPVRVALDGTPRRPFTGPVGVLVSGSSVSTSEMFAAALQATGRARIFGSRTPGMALPASARRLASGDTLLYVTADYIGPDGVRVEGAGVHPDEPIALTRRVLADCPDPVLSAAIAWIEGRAVSESCNLNQGKKS